MKIFRKNKKGFTVIEILVVMVIVAVLGGIVTASVIAVKNSSEAKSATNALTNYWRLTGQYLDQVNKKLTTTSTPNAQTLKTRLNLPNGKKEYLFLSTAECKNDDLGEDCLYIQYIDNPKSLYNQYTIKRITYNYQGRIYWTENGKDVTKV